MGASGRLADTIKAGKEGVRDAAYRHCYRARGGARRGEARALVENGGARALAEGVPTAALVEYRRDGFGGGGDSRRGFASWLGRPTAKTSPILALMNVYSYMRRQVSAGEIKKLGTRAQPASRHFPHFPH